MTALRLLHDIRNNKVVTNLGHVLAMQLPVCFCPLNLTRISLHLKIFMTLWPAKAEDLARRITQSLLQGTNKIQNRNYKIYFKGKKSICIALYCSEVFMQNNFRNKHFNSLERRQIWTLKLKIVIHGGADITYQSKENYNDIFYLSILI